MNIVKIIRIFISLVILIIMIMFAVVQLIPYGRDHTNPPVMQEPNWDAQTLAIAQKACFDCHSNKTVWPWYSNIAPVSWLIQHDVDEGRRNLNFSEWTSRGSHEVGESVAEGEMPPSQYFLLHPEAKLTNIDKQLLIQAFGR